MLYTIKQVTAAAFVLASPYAFEKHELFNIWLFNGTGKWFCISAIAIAVAVATLHLLKNEPHKETTAEDWTKNFQPDSFFPAKYDLSTQRVQRDKR